MLISLLHCTEPPPTEQYLALNVSSTKAEELWSRLTEMGHLCVPHSHLNKGRHSEGTELMTQSKLNYLPTQPWEHTVAAKSREYHFL